MRDMIDEDDQDPDSHVAGTQDAVGASDSAAATKVVTELADHLATIVDALQRLRREPLDMKAKRCLKRAETAADRAMDLIKLGAETPDCEPSADEQS